MIPDELFDRKYRWYGLSIADRIEVADCWEWTGGTDGKGYGIVRADGRTQSVHRLMWETLVGPIPDGLEIDHLCRNTTCCNPDHLDVVSSKENARRGQTGKYQARRTHCPYGHPFSGENLYLRPSGRGRRCRTCDRERSAARYLGKKAARV